MYLYTDKYFAWTRRRRKVERTKGTRQIFGGGRGQEENHNGFNSHTHVTILIVVMRISSESKVHDNYLALVLEVYIY